jgi:hypothetical protein
MYVDAPDGPNQARYRVGFDLDQDGHVRGGWGPWIVVPGTIGDLTHGASVAITDLTGSGDNDLVFFWVDDQEGSNKGYWRVGWHLDGDGRASDWGPFEWEEVPGHYGDDTHGGGVTATDFTRNGRPDLIFAAMDDPPGPDRLWYASRAT